VGQQVQWGRSSFVNPHPVASGFVSKVCVTGIILFLFAKVILLFPHLTQRFFSGALKECYMQAGTEGPDD
jgi:hypothetical protein